MGVLVVRAVTIVTLFTLEGAAYYLLFRRIVDWQWSRSSRATYLVLALPPIPTFLVGYLIIRHWLVFLFLLPELPLLGVLYAYLLMWGLDWQSYRELKKLFKNTRVRVGRW